MSVSTADGMPTRYQQLTQQAQRLSVNFRFKEDSAQLGNKAQRDIDRVLAYLRNNNKTERKRVLAGFGDKKSDPQRALLLSKLRAMGCVGSYTVTVLFFEKYLALAIQCPLLAIILTKTDLKIVA